MPNGGCSSAGAEKYKIRDFNNFSSILENQSKLEIS